MAAPYKPSLLARRLVSKLWGGRALETVLGIRLGGDAIGESWEVYDRPDGSSTMLANGLTLGEWMAGDRDELLGRGVRTGAGDRFPLLVKFIDAREALSVQVHPDDDQAAASGDGGKSEAWVVLATGPDARIICGVRPGVDRGRFAAAVEGPGVVELLHCFRPAVGDVIAVPPGLIHAIGPDVLVYEVQQNSDVTYRLYDWGRPRELHLDEGLEVARFDLVGAAVQPIAIGDDAEWLVRNPHFTLRRFTLRGPVTLGTEGRFKIATAIAGQGTIGWRSGGDDPPLQVRTGDSVLVPACTGTIFVSPVGGLTLLWAGPGEAAS